MMRKLEFNAHRAAITGNFAQRMQDLLLVDAAVTNTLRILAAPSLQCSLPMAAVCSAER